MKFNKLALAILLAFFVINAFCGSSVTTINATSSDQVYGSVTINGITYTAMCDCGDENVAELDEFGPLCDPSELTIHQDIPGTGLTADQLRSLIGMPAELSFVDAEKTSFSCLDGRNSDAVLGTLAGDAGEFILALYVYQTFLGTPFTQDAITFYFQKYLDYMKHDAFVMCTDDNAVSHLETELGVTALNLKSPRSSLESEILEAILEATNNGDTHIKLLLTYPEKYAIDVTIVEYFLTAFYSTLWADNEYSNRLSVIQYNILCAYQMKLEILTGDHNETAFVEIRSTEACTKAKLAPLIYTKDSSTDASMIVNHFDAVAVRRADLANFFTTYINPNLDGMTTEDFFQRMSHYGLLFLDNTGSYIAKNLPFYTVMID